MVVLPGGLPGATNLFHHTVLEKAIADRVANHKWMAAICAAPMILGKKRISEWKRSHLFPRI